MTFKNDNNTDNWETTLEGWKDIQEYIPTDKKIYSPFYCNGKQKEFFAEMGFDIIHEDTDYFTNTFEYDIIIDNPPFSKMKEITAKLKEDDKPFILILPPRYIHIKYFFKEFKDHLQVKIPITRTPFFNEDRDKYTPPGGTAFYFYKCNLEKDLEYI